MTTRWTANDIPSQAGRTAVITGANSGIGLETARELARAGATVVLACRNAEKGNAAVRDIASTGPGARLELADLDLASLRSVRSFAKRFSGAHRSLDLLINNAGVVAPSRRATEDGFELVFGTNHLGHFALTGLLLPMMQRRNDARVVTVSSIAHWSGRIAFTDLQTERLYDQWRVYAQSKLANLMFALELGRRLRADDSTISSMAAHPGWASTNLPAQAIPAIFTPMATFANLLFGQNAAMGALPTLYAATYPGLESGSYIGPNGPFESRGYPASVGSTLAARDEEAARRLWDISEDLTGVRFELGVPAR